MKRHPERLRAAGISAARYNELKAICRQYQEYQRMAARQRAGLVDRRGGNEPWRTRDPTGDAAVSMAGNPAARRIDILEACAMEAGGDVIGRALLRSVSEGVSYDCLQPPCGVKQFYNARLKFFVLLDRRLWHSQ